MEKESCSGGSVSMPYSNKKSFAACWPFVQPSVTTPLCNICVKGVLVAARTHPEGWSGRLCVIVTSRNKNSSVPCYSTNVLYSTERNSLCWQFFTSSCEREELSSSSSPLLGGEGRISPSLTLPSISSTKPQSDTVLLRVGFFVGGESRRERKEKESWHSKKKRSENKQ